SGNTPTTVVLPASTGCAGAADGLSLEQPVTEAAETKARTAARTGAERTPPAPGRGSVCRRASGRVVDEAQLGDLGDRLGQRHERRAAARFVEVDVAADAAVDVRDEAGAEARSLGLAARGDHDGSQMEDRDRAARGEADHALLDAEQAVVAIDDQLAA